MKARHNGYNWTHGLTPEARARVWEELLERGVPAPKKRKLTGFWLRMMPSTGKPKCVDLFHRTAEGKVTIIIPIMRKGELLPRGSLIEDYPYVYY